MTTDHMTETPAGAEVFEPSAEPFDSCEHPVWVAVGDGPASLPAVIEATKAGDPVEAVCRLVEASVRAALKAVGYRMDRPRAFEIGDAEPDGVTEVRDPARRRWARGHDGLWFMPEQVSPHLPWVEMLDRTGDVVEVLPGPAVPTRAEVIERAAEVFCDSSADGARWADLGEPARALYRRRQAAVADAGLLADPALFAEIARLRAQIGAAVAVLDEPVPAAPRGVHPLATQNHHRSQQVQRVRAELQGGVR
ncbi:hypothetical protein [Amycolatopsis kentuckyensis]|uniref:hypothetical protein n=1 Tax=Amycolatopsis kentuckyensis TaxID=218823 RepID=UPI0035656811